MTHEFDPDKFRAMPPDMMREERPDRLRDMMVGQQIARLVYFQDPSMFQGAQVGFMLRSHLRPVFLAADGEHLAALKKVPRWPYRWAIAMTLFEALTITTASMERAMTSDRHRVGDAPPDALQKRVEGELVLGAHHIAEPTKEGGEQIRLELSGGWDLWIRATPGAGAIFAGLELDLLDNVGRSVFVMKDPSGPRRRN